MPANCTLNKLTVSTNMAATGPATFTVQLGTTLTFDIPANPTNVLSGMSDTTLACTVSTGATSCSFTDSVPVTAGQFMSVKIGLSSPGTPTGFFGFWAVGCQ